MRASACLLLATGLLSGCGHWGNLARAEKSVQHRIVHVEESPVVVRTGNGRVDITADPTLGDVVIEASIRCVGKTMEEAETRLGESSLTVTRRDDRSLLVEPAFAPWPRNRGGDGASITIRVPNGRGVDVDTSNGNVSVTGLSGPLVIETSNGGVEVTGHDGETRVDTSNASIRVTDHVGRVRLKTSNGPVVVRGLDGPAVIDTSNGGVTVALHGSHSGPVEIDTSNAGISFHAGHAFTGTLALDTSNGAIQIRDAAGRVVSSSLRGSRGTVVVGETGPRSMLDTSNGGISVVIGDE